jgi:hypothetical protein
MSIKYPEANIFYKGTNLCEIEIISRKYDKRAEVSDSIFKIAMPPLSVHMYERR